MQFLYMLSHILWYIVGTGVTYLHLTVLNCTVSYFYTLHLTII